MRPIGTRHALPTKMAMIWRTGEGQGGLKAANKRRMDTLSNEGTRGKFPELRLTEHLNPQVTGHADAGVGEVLA